MKRIKSILQIAVCTLGILLITGGIADVPAMAFAADTDPAGEAVNEIGADEAAVESDKEETLTLYETAGDDAVFSDINEDVLELNPDSALPEDEGDYVVGANTVIDRIGMDGYDAVTDDNDNMELYTAFEADLNLEIQGGRYFKGHEILNFGDSDIKVYDKQNYEALTDGDDSTNATPKEKPSQFNTSMVFALNEIPVEMSDNYMLFVPDEDPEGGDASYLEKVTGTALYAWEYEKQDGTYKRVSSVPISGEDFMINDDNDTMYVNLYLGHIDTDKRSFDDLNTLGTYSAPKIYSYLSDHPDLKKTSYQHVPTLSGLVRLNVQGFKNPSENPIAIAALCYDATTTPEEDLYTTPSTEATGGYIYHDYSWDNNKGFAHTFSISDECYYYGRSGEVNYTKYWSDEPYYESKMGSFSLQPYKYRFTDTGNEHTLTLYNVYPYTLFVRRIQENYHVNYDNWKDESHSQANLLIDTWKIPATYTDPLSGTVYNVRIAKGGNIVPQFASKLIIEDGVGFPDDCSYLFSSTASVNLRCLSEIVIQGDAKSVGSNITNMSYMFLGKTGRQGMDATTYESLDFAALDTSNVTDMSFMFADVTMTNRTNIDVTTLDTSNVRNFAGMFRSYHVPSGLYQPATALDLSNFNTESAEDMSEMFEGSTVSALDLSGFDFSKVTDMSRMCTFTEKLESITFPSNMDSSKVTDMSFMFAGDYNLTQINNITAMDTGSVTDMSGMFGAHKCNQKKFETGYMYQEPDVYSGSYLYDKIEYELYGFAVFNPAWVTAELFNVNDGPALTSLDLTGFDTRKVKYANGMFYMPNLTEIKWGTKTTFEALSDAGGMFTLASVKKLDLTGRKFSNIKFASSGWFPIEMFNLNTATELVLGEDSIDLSNLSSKGQLMINAPELYSLDFRQVEMGANALAGEGALFYASPGSLQGASGLYEIYLPAGMPNLTSPAQLPGTFYDDNEGEYTVINGGYENDLHLVNPDKERRPQTITADDVTVTYGDTDKAVIATTDGGGGISYAVKAGSEDYIYIDASTGALTIWAVPDDGKAYVVVTAADTENYMQATKEVTVTINKARAVAATVNANNRTYDGTQKPLVTVRGQATGGRMLYALGTETEATGPYTASIPTGKKVGTYYVWYKVAGDDDHFDSGVRGPVRVVIASAPTPTPKPSATPTPKPSATPTPKPSPTPAPPKVSIKDAKIVLSQKSLTYNGKTRNVSVKSVTVNGRKLDPGKDYTVSWSPKTIKNAGTYTVTLKGKGDYTGSTGTKFVINKAENSVKVTGKTVTVNYSKLKKKSQTVKRSKIIGVSKNQGKVTYKKTKGSSKISIDETSGKLTVKKGLKKGSYTVKVKVSAAGDNNHKKGSKTVAIIIKVK